VSGSCEHGNEPSGSMKEGKFLDLLSDLAFQEGICSVDFSKSVSQISLLHYFNMLHHNILL